MKAFVTKEVSIISLTDYLKNNTLDNYKGEYAYIRNMQKKYNNPKNTPTVEDKYIGDAKWNNINGCAFRELPFDYFLKLYEEKGLEWCVESQDFHLTDYSI